MARIAVVRQGYFVICPRVRSEAESLLEAGHEVDVFCLRLPGEPKDQVQGRLRIRRFSIPHRRSGLASYVFEYLAFLLVAALQVGWRHLRRPYDLVQVNTIPDSLVFSALLPRLLGARVLIDLHESMPEFLSTKFKIGLRHPLVRLAAAVEQAAIGFADFATTCTEPMRRVFIARGAPAEKIGVVMNSTGLGLQATAIQRLAPHPGRFVLICHGTIEERYGLDTIVRALALLKDEIPDLDLAIYGNGSDVPRIRSMVAELELTDRVSFSNGWVPMPELIQAIVEADAGVVAMKRDAFRDLTLCTKMFDYIGLHKPAIVSRTRSVEEYFDASCFRLFTAGDEHDLARAITEVYRDGALRRRLVERASQVARPYHWSRQRERYLEIVTALVTGRRHEPITQPRDEEAEMPRLAQQ